MVTLRHSMVDRAAHVKRGLKFHTYIISVEGEDKALVEGVGPNSARGVYMDRFPGDGSYRYIDSVKSRRM